MVRANKGVSVDNANVSSSSYNKCKFNLVYLISIIFSMK